MVACFARMVTDVIPVVLPSGLWLRECDRRSVVARSRESVSAGQIDRQRAESLCLPVSLSLCLSLSPSLCL